MWQQGKLHLHLHLDVQQSHCSPGCKVRDVGSVPYTAHCTCSQPSFVGPAQAHVECKEITALECAPLKSVRLTPSPCRVPTTTAAVVHVML